MEQNPDSDLAAQRSPRRVLDEAEWYGPRQKSRFRVLRNERDGDGPLEIELTNEPGDPGPPLHWHPFAEEVFTVVEGRLSMTVGKDRRTLAAGETIVVPRGVAHTFKNADPARPVRFRSVHTPGRRFERLLGSMYDLDLDGRTDDAGMPPLLPLMALLDAHPDVTLVAGPPRLAQRALVKVLGAVARAMGHPPVYRSKLRAR